MQPAGEYLGEGYFHAGGVPAVVKELNEQACYYPDALAVNGSTIGANCSDAKVLDSE